MKEIGETIGQVVLVICLIGLIWLGVSYELSPLMLTLAAFGMFAVVGAVVGIVCFMFSWYLRSEEERKLREKRKEEYIRRKDEMLMSPQPFCRVLEMHDRDKIIVDTNVFMNAVEEEGNEIGERNEHKTYLKSAWFFGAVRQMKLQIHILTSQLNEISKIRRENDDRSKQYKARGALKLMDELQDEGLMVVLDDVITTRQSYADPEILKIVRKLLEEGQRPFVITEDRDLKIRVVALSVPCMPIDGIYNEGCRLQKRDWRRDQRRLGNGTLQVHVRNQGTMSTERIYRKDACIVDDSRGRGNDCE